MFNAEKSIVFHSWAKILGTDSFPIIPPSFFLSSLFCIFKLVTTCDNLYQPVTTCINRINDRQHRIILEIQ